MNKLLPLLLMPAAALSLLGFGKLVTADKNSLGKMKGASIALRGVEPHTEELVLRQLGIDAGIDARVDEVGNRVVVEGHRHGAGPLPERHEVDHAEQVGLVGDAEAADLGAAGVAKVLQLQSGERSEHQRGRGGWIKA